MFLSFRLGFFQIRKPGIIIKNTIGSLFIRETAVRSGISQKGAFCSVLAATMGTGNIIGVAAALSAGGPGAVFWMWISAIPGMMVVYAENYFGSTCAAEGKPGGAVAYTEKAAGRYVSLIYAFFCVLASFGMGNMVQTNSLASAVSHEFAVPAPLTGAVVSFLCCLIITGGIKRIASFTEILIPLISIVYIAASVTVIIKNHSELPGIFRTIFREAFGIKAVGGGIYGAALKNAVSTGMKRGVFSNEAGLGTSSMFHSVCSQRNPELQGMWGITEVFFDTIICCTLTALAVLCTSGTGSLAGYDSTGLVVTAFSECFGKYSGLFICISVSLFAFATLTGWSHCGETAFVHLTGGKFRYIFKGVYCILACAGAVLGIDDVWTISDIFNGLMIIPNITAIIILTLKYGMNTTE